MRAVGNSRQPICHLGPVLGRSPQVQLLGPEQSGLDLFSGPVLKGTEPDNPKLLLERQGTAQAPWCPPHHVLTWRHADTLYLKVCQGLWQHIITPILSLLWLPVAVDIQSLCDSKPLTIFQTIFL